MEYTREKLIEICEKATVLEKNWSDRDTPSAQMKLGECWALLKAGCTFRILNGSRADFVCTDTSTIWLEISHKSFNTFEDGDTGDDETYYLPTESRLKEREGRDWY